MMGGKLLHGIAVVFAIALLGGELGLIVLFLLTPYLPRPGP